ncbi:MAG: methionyl-tRNA formyltransferase [bacterium]
MKVVFMGTPDFAVPSLEKLVEGGFEIAAVVTQPDRPRGRGLRLGESPVKRYALERGLPVHQPEKVSSPEFVEALRSTAPDAIVVVAFGQYIPKSILGMPRYGCINVHASILPKYRGASPIHTAIIRGDDVTGVTTMMMDEGWDTGGILLQREVPISPEDDAGSLHDKLSRVGAELLVETLRGLALGEIVPIPQNDDEATYAPRLRREDGRIKWSGSARSIHNLVRGMSPHPGAYTLWRGRTLKVFRTRWTQETPRGNPGDVADVDRTRGIMVKCGEGGIYLEEVQLEGGRRMTWDEFIRGHDLKAGENMG